MTDHVKCEDQAQKNIFFPLIKMQNASNEFLNVTTSQWFILVNDQLFCNEKVYFSTSGQFHKLPY